MTGCGDTQARLAAAVRRRREKKPTMPTTVAEEMETNPYLRVYPALADLSI